MAVLEIPKKFTQIFENEKKENLPSITLKIKIFYKTFRKIISYTTYLF